MKPKVEIATNSHINDMMTIRMAVKENMLSDPSKVTYEDCRFFIEEKGRGWVCIVEEQVVGFCIVDVIERNLWALFILPSYEKKGIGAILHDTMIDWVRSQQIENLWLSTDPETRADGFYRKMGWIEKGILPSGERKFIYNLRS